MKIFTFTTIKASIIETETFVEFHLSRGIDHMLLYFDDPNDPSIELLKENTRVSCIVCDKNYWGDFETNNVPQKQSENSKNAIIQARKMGADWIGHIDSDEFIYTPKSLFEELSSAGSQIDTITLPVLEAIPESEDLFDSKFFKYAYTPQFNKRKFTYSISDRIRILQSKGAYLVRLFISKHFFKHRPFEYRLNKGHIEGKAFTRSNSSIATLEPHYPEPLKRGKLNIRIAASTRILHYDAPSFLSWKSKWEQKIIIGTPESARHRKRILQEFTSIYNSRDEKKLYDFYRMLYIPTAQELRTIQALGCVTEISPDHRPSSKSRE